MGAVWRQSVMYSTSSYHQGMSGDRPNALGLSDGPGMLRAQGRCGLGAGWCRLVQVGGHQWVHSMGGDGR